MAKSAAFKVVSEETEDTGGGIEVKGKPKMLSNRARIVSALTQWDSKQSANPKAQHNPYFLGIALGAIEDMAEDLPIRAAILGRFNGRLVPYLLRTVGEPPMTEDEARRNRRGW